MIIDLNDILNKAKEKGRITLQSGVFLESKESLIDDQATWTDEDSCKNENFTCADFWITTDDGCDPDPIKDADALKDFFIDMKFSFKDVFDLL